MKRLVERQQRRLGRRPSRRITPRTRDLTRLYHLIDSVDVETTRQELMRKATAIVRRGGSAALNFRDLGHSVGVKSSTVHYYFPTKSDLLNEIASEYTMMFLEALEEGTRDSSSFRQDMLVLVDLFVGAQGEKLSCPVRNAGNRGRPPQPRGEDHGQSVFCGVAGLGHAARQTARGCHTRAARTGNVRTTADLPAGRGIAPQPSPRPQGQPGSGQGVDRNVT